MGKLKEIIRKSLNLSNPSLLANTDLEETADDWFFVVGKKIPYQRLDEVEEKAYEIRNSTYPLHPNELIYAWELVRKGLTETDKSFECSFRRWHLEGYDRPHIQSSNFRTNDKIIIPCPTCRDKYETAKTEDFFIEMKLFKIAQVFIYAQRIHLARLLPLIDIEGNPITSAIDSGKILRDMSPLGQVRGEWKEKFEDFKATDFNDRQTQKEISADLYRLRKQELDLIGKK